MEQWASRGSNPGRGEFRHVAFFCINVDGPGEGPQVARQFAMDLRLHNVINGFIERDADMPTFGQLGCSGFVIAKADGVVTNGRTPAFLECRQQAFTWMVQQLHALAGPPHVVRGCGNGTEQGAVSASFVRTLSSELKDHIEKFDTLYADYMSARGVQ